MIPAPQDTKYYDEAFHQFRMSIMGGRDHFRCKFQGCKTRTRLTIHHIVHRSHGGPDEGWNVVTLCRKHHRLVHRLWG